jgi:CheY-like chemotaxis protein
MAGPPKSVLVLFDDDPQEMPRIVSMFGDRYEVLCEPNLHQCASDEDCNLRAVESVEPGRIKAVIVDLIDSKEGPRGARPGERIFRRMRSRYEKGHGIPVVVLSVLADDSGNMREEQLAHLVAQADAVLAKSEKGYRDLQALLENHRAEH